MKGPYQIKVAQNDLEPEKYDLQLIHEPTGKLVTANYRQKSPFADRLMLRRQATLNTKALLDLNLFN